MIRNLKLNKRAAALLLAASMTCALTGCEDKEMASPNIYDTIDTNTDSDTLANGYRQVKSVDGEDFDLVIDYKCDLEEQENWTITSDKKLTMEIKTENLPKDYKVFIDNVHTDTSIIASNAAFNGVLQDTMDDRIHNSLMLGFPISDNINYISANAIEGCNESFISGTYYGAQGYSNGSFTQKRYTESDYQKLGVYANKISIVYDLLIKGPNDIDYKNVSLDTEFIVYTSDVEIEYGDSQDIEETKKLVKEKNK